jgi:hypothetical protein
MQWGIPFALALAFLPFQHNLHAQAKALIYEGRLNGRGSPADDSHLLTSTLLATAGGTREFATVPTTLSARFYRLFQSGL